jgi:hypothetical protein
MSTTRSPRPPTAALGVVAVAVTVGLALPAQVAIPGAAAATTLTADRRVARAEELLACPDLRTGAAESTISLTVPTAGPGGAPVQAEAGALGAGGPGLTVLTAPAEPAPVIVRAEGVGAAGVVAGRRTLALDGTQRGLSVLACPAATRDAWFVGSGSQIGRRGRLELINPTAAAVVVDIELAGPDGPLLAPAGRGVTIAPGASATIKLDALVPDVAVFAVHVVARAGRVAAALRDEEAFGVSLPGVDWVPPAAAPARTVVVPGVVRLPEEQGHRLLHVFVPGAADAVARLRFLGTEGPLAVAGLDVVRLRAGRVTTFDLAAVGAAHLLGIEVTGDVPLTAGVHILRAAVYGDPADQAWTAAVAPTPAGAVLRSPLLPGNSSSGLLLSAPGAAAQVEVSVLIAGQAPDAQGAPMLVSVPAGGTVAVPTTQVLGGRDGAVTVRATPGSPSYVAGISVVGGRPMEPLLALSPLTARPLDVAVPAVALDLWAGVRRDP